MCPAAARFNPELEGEARFARRQQPLVNHAAIQVSNTPD
jgi:hypothetical protein